MSTFDTFRAPAAPSFGVVAKLREMISSWADVRVTRNALNRLSDRELDDIGLSRSDIERVARGL
ncbi:DUF1127 domain-containing protein [Paracoccus luteus]|uniref:DUF1127 domain-containing protein n=1 Tax=Paracoccus luteus TaxID=2508543 RepID=UPI00106F336F|nr:DUF1127 domain-containing protein [Paracoccus luteus]